VVKQVFFLLFLFALGYKLGPQFFSGLKGDGLPQAVFTLILVVVGFVTVIVLSLVLDFNAGVAAGLAAGGLTQSSIIGVAQDSIPQLGLDPDTAEQWQDLVSVGYAVTYIFGTVGAAIYCANVAPRLLGIKDLPQAAKEVSAASDSTRKSPTWRRRTARSCTGPTGCVTSRTARRRWRGSRETWRRRSTAGRST
jgi:putative transport protein